MNTTIPRQNKARYWVILLLLAYSMQLVSGSVHASMMLNSMIQKPVQTTEQRIQRIPKKPLELEGARLPAHSTIITQSTHGSTTKTCHGQKLEITGRQTQKLIPIEVAKDCCNDGGCSVNHCSSASAVFVWIKLPNYFAHYIGDSIYTFSPHSAYSKSLFRPPIYA